MNEIIHEQIYHIIIWIYSKKWISTSLMRRHYTKYFLCSMKSTKHFSPMHFLFPGHKITWVLQKASFQSYKYFYWLIDLTLITTLFHYQYNIVITLIEFYLKSCKLIYGCLQTGTMFLLRINDVPLPFWFKTVGNVRKQRQALTTHIFSGASVYLKYSLGTVPHKITYSPRPKILNSNKFC